MCAGLHFYFYFENQEQLNTKKASLIFEWISKELFVLLLFDLVCCCCCGFVFSSLDKKENQIKRKEQNEEAERITCISCLTLELIGSCNSLKLRMSAHGISLKSLSYIVNRTTYMHIVYASIASLAQKGSGNILCIVCVYTYIIFFKEAINCLKRWREKIRK